MSSERLLSTLEHPSAWEGADFQDPSSYSVNISDTHVAELHSALQAVKKRDVTFNHVTAADFPLPTLARLLTKVIDETETGRGFAVVRGIPVEGYGVPELELMYAGILSHIGTLIVQDTLGTLIDHVADRGLSYDSIHVRGYTTNAELTPHCDSGDLLGLLCVRRAKTGGMSTIASSMSIYNRIVADYPQYLNVLYGGFHYNIRGNGPPGPYQDITRHRVPVYCYHAGRLSCRFNLKAMLTAEELEGVPPLTQLEKDAVNTVARLAMDEKLRLDLFLEAGDLMLLNNNTVFHTRTAFTDFDELEKKRLLLRTWINVPQGRPLPEVFADHYNTGPRQGPHVHPRPVGIRNR
jgi:hypothetical protein